MANEIREVEHQIMAHELDLELPEDKDKAIEYLLDKYARIRGLLKIFSGCDSCAMTPESNMKVCTMKLQGLCNNCDKWRPRV